MVYTVNKVYSSHKLRNFFQVCVCLVYVNLFLSPWLYNVEGAAFVKKFASNKFWNF